MLRDAINTFKDIYDKKEKIFITDSYVPADGD